MRSNERDIFGHEPERFDEPEPRALDDIDASIKSGDLTMDEVFGPGGEDDPMPHMDGYFDGF